MATTTASVKTPIKINVNQQIQKPTIKTPIVKRKLGKDKELGALWTWEPKNGGEEYMTGKITINGNETSIILYRNGYKDAENQPDWRIYLREPMLKTELTNTILSEVVEDQQLL